MSNRINIFKEKVCFYRLSFFIAFYHYRILEKCEIEKEFIQFAYSNIIIKLYCANSISGLIKRRVLEEGVACKIAETFLKCGEEYLLPMLTAGEFCYDGFGKL